MIAYLCWPMVVHVGDAPPFGLDFDTVMPNAPGNPAVGQVWDGAGFVAATGDMANVITLRQQATQAFLDNRAFLNIASPTNAQTLAQVKALTRQVNGLMRLVLSQFDGTN